MAKLVVLLRVKDGIFFLREWLECYDKIADEIVALDNGSTDGTYEMLDAHPKVTDLTRTQGYNEGYDKNLMYQRARMRKPDWCLWVDVDEIFESGLTREHFDRLMSRKYVNKYAFRRFHFIDREFFAGSWFRLNYSSGHDRLMWRENSSGYFENVVIDSPNVKGIGGIKLNTHFRLKHLGYISKEIVDKKADIYRQIIPQNEAIFQTMYLHNERKIKWHDDRKHRHVVLLNGLLDCLLAVNLFPKAYRKFKRLLFTRKHAQALPSAMPENIGS